jgi:hypothetical protein
MYKLYAVWTHPDDVDGFEKHCVETHAPSPPRFRPELEAAAQDAGEMQERFGVTLHSPAGAAVEERLGPYAG